MNQKILITNAKAVCPDRIIPDAQILLCDGCIEQISRLHEIRSVETKQVIDAGGGYLMPGFIDIHSDAIEKEIEPRPGAFFDSDLAFTELEKKLPGQGITTMFHSFSFSGAEWGLREDENAAHIVRRMVNKARLRTIIRNKIHARFEITNFAGVEVIQQLLTDGMVDLLSLMDHTPGQGQYPTIDDYRRYMQKTYHLHLDQMDQILAEKEKGRSKCDETIDQLVQTAKALCVPIASHDDDSPESVLALKHRGITINEFPVNEAAAHSARSLGNDVCVGGPNIVRGGSSGKAMRAVDAIISGDANIICSDYYPPSILHAVFKLSQEVMSLPEAVNMATREPARATFLNRLGTLTEGNWGDLIIVRFSHEQPVVTDTFVNGDRVFSLNYRIQPRAVKNNEKKGGVDALHIVR